MERPLTQIQETLQKLIGLHRQLLDAVRMERDALVQARVRDIEDAVYAKQALIEGIRQAEAARMKFVAELATLWKKPARDLTLGNIVIEIQAREPKFAEQLRSALNALNILIKRVSEQNEDNRALVDRSLESIHTMKKNVLGEVSPKTDVYNQKGHKAAATASSRLISKEV